MGLAVGVGRGEGEGSGTDMLDRMGDCAAQGGVYSCRDEMTQGVTRGL